MRRADCQKALLVAVGLLAVVLGTIGIFLPLLPTTPFLLLAAACFVRSSERLYQWLLNHKWFGSYIRNYREHRAISLRTKVVGIVMLWATIGYSVVMVVSAWWLRALLLVIATGVTLHLLHIKTLTREMSEADLQRDKRRQP
jgi:uncharacterized membrane protein YbaN (DUF454 family)